MEYIVARGDTALCFLDSHASELDTTDIGALAASGV